MARRFFIYCVSLMEKKTVLADLYLLCVPNGKGEWLVDFLSIVCP